MEHNQTLVRKRVRITHKADLSLLSAALLNRLEAACCNSRDPVNVLSMGVTSTSKKVKSSFI